MRADRKEVISEAKYALSSCYTEREDISLGSYCMLRSRSERTLPWPGVRYPNSANRDLLFQIATRRSKTHKTSWQVLKRQSHTDPFLEVLDLQREITQREVFLISSCDALTNLYREPFLGMAALLARLFGFGAQTLRQERDQRQ